MKTKGNLIIIGCYIIAYGTVAFLCGWRPKFVKKLKINKANKMVVSALKEEFERDANGSGITMEELLKQIEIVD